MKAQSPLHSPHFDFNDDTLELGAAYWVSLVEAALELAKSPP